MKFIALAALVTFSSFALAKQAAFKIGSKVIYVEDLMKKDAAAFYKLEKQRFDLIARLAQTQYLDSFWAKLAKKSGKSTEAAKNDYIEKNSKVSKKEIADTVNQFKDHPQLKKLSKAEQEKQVTSYLKGRKKGQLISDIVQKAESKKELVVLYKEPKEPIIKIKVDEKNDFIRYSGDPEYTKSRGCTTNCPITVVEYSEFQCPFCEKVLGTSKRLMNEYRGKVRWIVRDFPLSFHPRAEPAARAAHCAGNQNKEYFWAMYFNLFENQKKLEDKDFNGYAKKIKGLSFAKWQKCYKTTPSRIKDQISANQASGAKYGVTGTPAFFINGRMKSGALPYEEFKKVFDQELKAKKG